jgi:enediyne biosynthesis protein E4
MGVGIGDYDLDGHLDLFKTHFADDSCVLYRNTGKGNFDDVTRQARIGVETRFVCWGAGIVDLDNDGNPDLFMVAGNVYPEVEKKLPQYAYKNPRMLFRNLGNRTFEELVDEAGPGIAQAHSSRGCAFGDFDNDGDIDILIINMHEPPSLLRNDIREKTNWIKIKLEGVKSNRSAIGARVLARYGGKVQAQSLLSQSSYYSCNDPRLHFGLGSATLVDLEVHWPNGLIESFKHLHANQLITVREGVGPVPNRGWAKS